MSERKAVQVTVTETVYRKTIVTVNVTRHEDVEEKAREAANNAEWEDVSSDGYDFAFDAPDFGEPDGCPKCDTEIDDGDMKYDAAGHEVCPWCSEKLERPV